MHLGLLFLSPQAYMLPTFKDSGKIYIYSFGDSPKRPTHVAMLHLPILHDERALLELTTTTGPFLARPPPFASAPNACVHVFTYHHDQLAERGRWQPSCFVMHNQALMQYVDACREEAGAAADVPRKEWGPHGTRFCPSAARGGVIVSLMSGWEQHPAALVVRVRSC
jgi:hypothetical protein